MIIQTLVDEEPVDVELDLEHNEFTITLSDDSNVYQFAQLSYVQMRDLYNDLKIFFEDDDK